MATYTARAYMHSRRKDVVGLEMVWTMIELLRYLGTSFGDDIHLDSYPNDTYFFWKSTAVVDLGPCAHSPSRPGATVGSSNREGHGAASGGTPETRRQSSAFRSHDREARRHRGGFAPEELGVAAT